MARPGLKPATSDNEANAFTTRPPSRLTRKNVIQKARIQFNVKPFYLQTAGEPPLLLAISVIAALKEAVRTARAEIDHHGYFRLDSPATVAKIQTACGNQLKTI